MKNHAIRGFVPPTPVTQTWEQVPSVTFQVVAVCGTLDSPDHLAMAHRLASSVAHGEAVDIPGTAHYPNLERPVEFDRAVARPAAGR